MQNLITIIVPVFNSAKTLKSCVQSVLNQSYKNVKIILVNNGSTDNSLQICEELEEKNPKDIKIINLKTPGVSAARNTGLLNATGYYVMFLDSDDQLKLGSLKSLVEYLDRTDADIVVGDYNRIFIEKTDNQTKKFSYNNSLNIPKNSAQTIFDNKRIVVDIYTAPWGKLYKKTALLDKDKEVLFSTQYMRNEDIDFTIRSILTGGKIAFLDQPVLDYYVYEKSGTIKKMLNVDDTIDIFSNILKYYQKYNVDVLFSEELTYLKIYHLLIGEVYRLIMYNAKLDEVKKIASTVTLNEVRSNSYFKELSLTYRIYIRVLLRFPLVAAYIAKIFLA